MEQDEYPICSTAGCRGGTSRSRATPRNINGSQSTFYILHNTSYFLLLIIVLCRYLSVPKTMGGLSICLKAFGIPLNLEISDYDEGL